MVDAARLDLTSIASILAQWIREVSDGVVICIKVQPRASTNEVGEALGDELRIKVTAPPVDSAANEALLRLLTEQIGCRRAQIELLRGQASRHKVVKVHGISVETVLGKLGKSGTS